MSHECQTQSWTLQRTIITHADFSSAPCPRWCSRCSHFSACLGFPCVLPGQLMPSAAPNQEAPPPRLKSQLLPELGARKEAGSDFSVIKIELVEKQIFLYTCIYFYYTVSLLIFLNDDLNELFDWTLA